VDGAEKLVELRSVCVCHRISLGSTPTGVRKSRDDDPTMLRHKDRVL
jgi:hypothetical protein